MRKNVMVNRAELGYKDFGVSDTSSIAICILWHQLIPHKTRVLLPCLVRHIRVCTSDITTLPVVRCNITVRDAGYFENSALSSSLWKQALHSYRYIHKFQERKITAVKVIQNFVLPVLCKWDFRSSGILGSVTDDSRNAWSLMTDPIVCPGTFVTNYPPKLSNTPEERTFQL